MTVSILCQIIQAFTELDQFFANLLQTIHNFGCLSGFLLIHFQALLHNTNLRIGYPSQCLPCGTGGYYHLPSWER